MWSTPGRQGRAGKHAHRAHADRARTSMRTALPPVQCSGFIRMPPPRAVEGDRSVAEPADRRRGRMTSADEPVEVAEPPSPRAVAIRVWDLPTRLFHWVLVLCVAGS